MFKVGDSTETGYHLVAMSRVWWDIVLNHCPDLWAYFCVVFEDFLGSEENCAFLEHPTSLVLTRSRNQPLHFLFTSLGAECNKEASFAVFWILLSQGTCWQSAILYVDSLHMPLVYSLCGQCPHLLLCWIMMQEPVA